MVKQGVRIAVVAAFVALGWSVGRAQATATDFELVVTKHEGGMDMQVQCVRGCNLATRQDSGPIDPQKGKKDIGFACRNQSRCDIYVAGWVQR
jgi:hypothetical protein